MNKSICSIILLFLISPCLSQQISLGNPANYESQWVDSLYNKMNLEERVGQLFMVATYSDRDSVHTDTIKKLIKNDNIGGLIFFQGGPVRQARLTNEYQSHSKIPLLIGIDAEWGLKMRLDSTYGYPSNMTLGAIQDNDLIRQIGVKIGQHCKRLGIHINFAPVADINTNPKNPVIGIRSYGEDKKNVANKSVAFTKGMQSENVMACAKHFPGHGDTDTDSHKTLPTISFSAKRIDSVELYPFKQLFASGIASAMVGHLNVPELENSPGLPSSLSYNIVSELLKRDLAFKGLIFTDALNMKGAANYKEPGDIDLAAFQAGNDVLLFSENVPKATKKIIDAYKNKRLTETRLAHSVKKILSAKFRVGLNKYEPIKVSNLRAELNLKEDHILYQDAISKAITVIKNKDHLLPILKRDTKAAYISLGSGTNNEFLATLKEHIKVDEIMETRLDVLLEKLKAYNTVIIGYHKSNTRQISKFTNNEVRWIQEIAAKNKVILDVFGNQYSLTDLPLSQIEGVVISYENTKVSQNISAQIILGIKGAEGRLPATINREFSVGHGIEDNPLHFRD